MEQSMKPGGEKRERNRRDGGKCSNKRFLVMNKNGIEEVTW